MTPQSIITIARTIYNDADSVYFRISNDELVGFVNDAIKECSTIAPQYFMTSSDFVCTAGQTEQEITFATAQKIIDVLRIKNGKAVLPVDLISLSSFNPTWSSDAAGAAQNWSRYAGDPLRFYIYPKAPDNQTLELIYLRNPLTYTLNDAITEVPESVAPALADYVIYRAESRDDEHSNSGRAVSHYQAFVQKLGGKVSAPQNTQGA